MKFKTPIYFAPATDDGAAAPDGIVIPVVPEAAPPAPTVTADAVPPAEATFTADDIERARREEKDKLYPEINALKDEVKGFRTAAEETAAASRAEADRLAAEAEERRVGELSALERVAEVERTFAEKLAAMEQKNSENEALLERERRYNELMSYRAERLQAEGIKDSIAPEFLDYIWGEDEAEIDRAIATAQQKTASILEEVAAAQQQFRQRQQGVSLTGTPPVGPMENHQAHQTVTADDIRNMDMATYAKQRNALLGGASNLARNRGLYN